MRFIELETLGRGETTLLNVDHIVEVKAEAKNRSVGTNEAGGQVVKRVTHLLIRLAGDEESLQFSVVGDPYDDEDPDDSVDPSQAVRDFAKKVRSLPKG